MSPCVSKLGVLGWTSPWTLLAHSDKPKENQGACISQRSPGLSSQNPGREFGTGGHGHASSRRASLRTRGDLQGTSNVGCVCGGGRPPPIPRRGSFQRSHDTSRNELVWIGRCASAASLLIGGLGESFHPCCFNDNCGGAGAICRGGVFLLSHSAMQRVSPHHPSCKSVPVPFQLLGSARAFHLLFLPVSGSISHVFTPLPHLLSFPLRLLSSPISGCSICLTVQFHFYGLESLL